jgi:ankyrin repeat protein
MRGHETPLEHAARCGDLETTRVILDFGVHAYPSVRSGRSALAGLPPNRKRPAAGKWSQIELQEALVPAVGFDHEDVVRLLHERGADPNGGPRPGVPLIEAAGSHRRDMVRYLLDSGADPDGSESSEDTTALGMARLHRQNEIVRLLAERGARLARLKYPARRSPGL